jgi:hypothetical protein
MSLVVTPNRVRVVQDVVLTNAPIFSVELPERTSASITNYGNQAILKDRINDQRRADDYAREAHAAQVRAFLAKQEQQIRLATQKAEWDNAMQAAENKAAIKLAEPEAETAMQLTAIRYRNDIQVAETKAAHEAQLQHIRQIDSQRTAMTPMTNPSIQAASDPLPEEHHDMAMEGPSVIYNTAQSLHQLSFEMSPVDRGVADSPVSLNLSDSRCGERVLVCRSQTLKNDPQRLRHETTRPPVCVSVDDDYNKAKAEHAKREHRIPQLRKMTRRNESFVIA